jgi:hypothetical protein
LNTKKQVQCGTIYDKILDHLIVFFFERSAIAIDIWGDGKALK